MTRAEDTGRLRAAVAAAVAAHPDLGQRDIANLVGCSQKSVSRHMTALRDSSNHAAAQPVSGSPGAVFRAALDAELARVGCILGGQLRWSPAEAETLAIVASAQDRRAVLDAAWRSCQDAGSDRALRLAAEIRHLDASITRSINGIHADLAKLVAAQAVSEADATGPAAPPTGAETVISIKARRAVNTRWKRQRMADAAAAADATGLHQGV